MTFCAGAGAKAVLRVILIGVTALSVFLLRWLVGAFWWCLPLPLSVFLFWWYLPHLTGSLYGKLDTERLYVRYGILWRRETVVPLSALRTFEAWTPPLHRLFHCRTVVLRFAGGSVFLPLLDEKTAQTVAARLEEC